MATNDTLARIESITDKMLKLDQNELARDAARADAIVRRTKAATERELAKAREAKAEREKEWDARKQESQVRNDELLERFGVSCPPPQAGEGPRAYERRTNALLASYLPRDHALRSVDFATLPADAHSVFTEQLRDAVGKTSLSNEHAPASGELVPRKVRDAAGTVSTIFLGRESFVKSMGRPARRVAAFRTPVDAAGRELGHYRIP